MRPFFNTYAIRAKIYALRKDETNDYYETPANILCCSPPHWRLSPTSDRRNAY